MSYTFHHIHLLCSDLENTITFFRDMLGASLVCYKKFGAADGATLDLNGTMVNLRVATDSEHMAGDSSVLTFGYHHICVSTENVDEAYAELTGKGVEFISPPVDALGNRIAFCKGPDNIVIEVLQPPAS
jgi:catechol 2,3-dioxygenase-like lactoylglutathione lyase family enzyme